MANELQAVYATGRVVYCNIRHLNSGTVWNTSTNAFEAYATGSLSSYTVSLTEAGTASQYYMGNMPGQIGAGVYAVVARERIAGSVAETDPNIATGTIQWASSGGPYRSIAELASSGQIAQNLPTRITKGVAISGFMVKMVSSSDHVTALTSGVYSGQVSKDGGAFAALASGTLAAGYTEVGLGLFRVNLTSGDLQGDVIALHFNAAGISGGTADPRDMVFITQRISGAF